MLFRSDGNEVDPSQTTTETTTEDSGSSDVKSVEGSITMFIMVCIMCSAVFLVYGAIDYNIPNYNFAFVVFISLIATVCEAVTPKGLDNLSVSSVSAVLYYILMV